MQTNGPAADDSRRPVCIGWTPRSSEQVRDQIEQHQHAERYAEQPCDQIFAHVVVLRVAATQDASRRGETTGASKLAIEFLQLLLGFVARDSVTFLDPAGQILAVAFGDREIVVGQLAPLGLQLAGQLLPLTLDLVFVHGVLLE
ncbi:hypothetical protein BDI4_380006 [Burkholderia diffusa]|nr:hypothetical protein BDI4_380006 [Burkholderia diffusa]